MNNQRRKEVREISKRLTEELSALAESLRDDIEQVKMEEEESYDNLPESIKHSDRGEEMESIAEHLDDAFSSMDDVCSSINEALEYLDQSLL